MKNGQPLNKYQFILQELDANKIYLISTDILENIYELAVQQDYINVLGKDLEPIHIDYLYKEYLIKYRRKCTNFPDKMKVINFPVEPMSYEDYIENYINDIWNLYIIDEENGIHKHTYTLSDKIAEELQQYSRKRFYELSDNDKNILYKTYLYLFTSVHWSFKSKYDKWCKENTIFTTQLMEQHEKNM